MDVQQRIINIIAEELEVDASAITANTELQADLGADSVDNVSILTHINHEFKLSLGEEDVIHVKSIADLENIIKTASNNR